MQNKEDFEKNLQSSNLGVSHERSHIQLQPQDIISSQNQIQENKELDAMIQNLSQNNQIHNPFQIQSQNNQQNQIFLQSQSQELQILNDSQYSLQNNGYQKHQNKIDSLEIIENLVDDKQELQIIESQNSFTLGVYVEMGENSDTQMEEIFVNSALYSIFIEDFQELITRIHDLNQFYKENFSFDQEKGKIDPVQLGQKNKRNSIQKLASILDGIKQSNLSIRSSGFFKNPQDLDRIKYMDQLINVIESEHLQYYLNQFIDEKKLKFNLPLEYYRQKVQDGEDIFKKFQMLCNEFTIHLSKYFEQFEQGRSDRYNLANLTIFMIYKTFKDCYDDQIKDSKTKIVINKHQKIFESVFKRVIKMNFSSNDIQLFNDKLLDLQEVKNQNQVDQIMQ